MQRLTDAKWMTAVVALAALTTLQGCTVGPRYHAPAPPAVTSYTPQPLPAQTASSAGLAGDAQHFNASAPVPASWWNVFGSPELDAMVAQALANSPTLAQATARLKQAQEEVNARTGATKYPTVTGNAGVTEEQLNLAALGVPFPNPSPFTLLNGSVAVSYALDIFGANRRAIEALRAERDYQAWQLEGARLMLAGNVVSAAIRQAQIRSQIEITRQLLAVEQQQLRIAEERHGAGGLSDYDLRSQRTQVAQTEASIPPLELQLDTIDNQLAVLMGLSPAEAHVPGISLDKLHLPEELPLTVPSELVRQRPDIRAAEALLHEAGANVGVATANLYPQIVLTGSGGGLGTRFDTGGGVWNVGASLAAPIFNGGALQAEKRKAQDAYDAAAAVYRQTVLESFREVADALNAVERDAQALRARTAAAGESDGAYAIAAQRYQAGGISQLALLDAQRQQLETALDRSNAAASRYTDSATLFQALGGSAKN
ncbi:MAG: efflux transporter outer membrane subunit [Terracidiphilus sp.]|jgi:NodT family efflux transporter outer membrane factor (OMF) lipoprotein